jgi:kinesin family protein 2/24
MENFYLKNIPKYDSLIDTLDPCPKPRISKGIPSPSMVVSARIRPLSEDEDFPSAIFARSSQKNVLDIHDLYNHPSGNPKLRVCIANKSELVLLI